MCRTAMDVNNNEVASTENEKWQIAVIRAYMFWSFLYIHRCATKFPRLAYKYNTQDAHTHYTHTIYRVRHWNFLTVEMNNTIGIKKHLKNVLFCYIIKVTSILINALN